MDLVLEPVDAELVKSTTTLLGRIYWKTETGQHRVVLSPNDADKTSLIHTAFGRLSLNKGNATLDSQNLKGIDPAELAARVTPILKSSAPSIRGDQRVLDLVRTTAWGVSVHREEEYEAEDEACRQDLFEIFGIFHLAQCEFRTLLEGEAQRVLLARSLVLDPEVLILDGPGAGFGLRVRGLLLSTLEEIMSGTCAPQVALVTHQMEDIPAGIIYTAIVAKGRIIARGPIDETLAGVNLSHAYELPLGTDRNAGRWWTRGLKQS